MICFRSTRRNAGSIRGLYVPKGLKDFNLMMFTEVIEQPNS